MLSFSNEVEKEIKAANDFNPNDIHACGDVQLVEVS
jgi:hypothetical protein